jgi:hypothetical protein
VLQLVEIGGLAMVLGVRSPMADARATRQVFAADVALGCAAVAWKTACAGSAKLARKGTRLGRLLPISISPGLVRVLSPEGLLNPAARRGRDVRSTVGLEVDRIVRALAPDVVRTVLDELDLTAIVRERVDIDAVVEDIDVDAVAARLDLDRVAARLDIDRIIDRVDVDASPRGSTWTRSWPGWTSSGWPTSSWTGSICPALSASQAARWRPRPYAASGCRASRLTTPCPGW